MSPSDETFSLQELSELTETETRNIRYYISIGLLPAPLSRGRDARYSKLHKQRLEWVKLLREQYKLDEIRQFFQELSDEEIQGLLNNVSVKPPNEAASYLTSVAAAFEASSRGSSTDKRKRSVNRAPERAQRSLFGSEVEGLAPLEQLLHKLEPEKGGKHVPSRPAQRWEVIEIVPGIELHVRNPSRSLQSRLERACDYIRHLLKGGSYD
jgi:DNA-binding transcriptional MerR regulator